MWNTVTRITVAAAIAVTGAALTTAPARAAPPAPWRVIDLGALPGGSQSEARAVNDRGEVVGASDTGDPMYVPRHAFLWRDGQLTDLGALVDGGYSEATGINDRGVVVGNSDSGTGYTRAFRWHAGRMVDIGTLGGNSSFATGINNRGDIVGFSETAEGVSRGFVWRAGRMTELSTVDGRSSVAAAVNERGDIVGRSTYDGMNELPVRWRGGQLESLNPPQTPGAAVAVNDRGQIVGTIAGGTSQPALWDRGRVTGLGTLDGASVEARGMSNGGHVVGHDYRTWAPFVWHAGQMTRLPTPKGQGTAADVNNHRQIAGSMTIADNTAHAVLWTC